MCNLFFCLYVSILITQNKTIMKKSLNTFLFALTVFFFTMIITSCGYHTCPTYAFSYGERIRESVAVKHNNFKGSKFWNHRRR